MVTLLTSSGPHTSPNRWRRHNKDFSFLRKLKYTRLPQNLLINFYRSAIESLLTYCCTVWYSSCTEENRKDLWRVVRAAERVIGMPLPILHDIYTGRLQQKANCILKAPTSPGHHLFSPYLLGERYRAIKSQNQQTKKQFLPTGSGCTFLDNSGLTYDYQNYFSRKGIDALSLQQHTN